MNIYQLQSIFIFYLLVKSDGPNGEVVLDDENKFGGAAWQCCRRMIYVPRSAQKGFAVGFWPIPEAFWPDVNAPSLVIDCFRILLRVSHNFSDK